MSAQTWLDAGVPANLVAFWQEHEVNPGLVPIEDQNRRYFRITRLGLETEQQTVASLKRTWPDSLLPAGLPNFYSVDASEGLSTSDVYSDGLIVGIDICSGAVIWHGLDVRPGHHVLDLCCAPGAKMSLLSELACSSDDAGSDSGSVTGVDPVDYRINVTRNVLRKYQCRSVRLFMTDGRSFSQLAPPSEAQIKEMQIEKGLDAIPPFKPLKVLELSSGGLLTPQAVRFTPHISAYAAESATKQKMKHFWDRPNLKWSSSFRPSFESYQLYDRVLVDAECTTDGAVRHHIQKARKEYDALAEQRERGIVHPYRTAKEVEDTVTLQQELLARGYQLLKAGGLLLYSTCSLLRVQNEGVLEHFLKAFPNAIIEPFDNLALMPTVVTQSSIPNALYLKGGNSLFAARIRKPAQRAPLAAE